MGCGGHSREREHSHQSELPLFSLFLETLMLPYPVQRSWTAASSCASWRALQSWSSARGHCVRSHHFGRRRQDREPNNQSGRHCCQPAHRGHGKHSRTSPGQGSAGAIKGCSIVNTLLQSVPSRRSAPPRFPVMCGHESREGGPPRGSPWNNWHCDTA